MEEQRKREKMKQEREGGKRSQANILLVVEIEIERGGYSAGFICTQSCNRYQQ